MKQRAELGKTKYQAALYLRLSKDDEHGQESSSIDTQRKLLQAYAAEQGFAVFDEYVDDGVSGTTFDRPGFQRMIRDIEKQRVNLVLTKDLSRLGRDYLQAGQYTEVYFPAKKVRYIAVNDGYDSDGLYADMVPFKHVLNEMYARDTSRKIRSAFTTHMKEGDFVGAFAPYGYRRDEHNRHRLEVDEQVEKIVREIFQKAAQGQSPTELAKALNARRIPPPLAYRRHQKGETAEECGTGWTASTLSKMLRNPVYLGHMVQGKTQKRSFKQAAIAIPREEWIVVEDTHEALVSNACFEQVGRRMKQRACPSNGVFHNLFSGLARCADCGRLMSAVGSRKKGASANLVCGGYKLYGKNACSNHFIDYDDLYQLVLTAIRQQVELCLNQRGVLEEAVRLRVQKMVTTDDGEKRKVAWQRRRQELARMTEQLYEDSAKGVLSVERRQTLVRRYEEEREALSARLKALQKQSPTRAEEVLAQKKEELASLYSLQKLTSEWLFYLIDRIEIGQGSYQSVDKEKVKQQTVRIFFRFRCATKEPKSEASHSASNSPCAWGLDAMR